MMQGEISPYRRVERLVTLRADKLEVDDMQSSFVNAVHLPCEANVLTGADAIRSTMSA